MTLNASGPIILAGTTAGRRATVLYMVQVEEVLVEQAHKASLLLPIPSLSSLLQATCF